MPRQSAFRKEFTRRLDIPRNLRAQLVGPGIAGALIQWLTAPFAILLDALSFLLSAWILRGIRSGPNDAPKMRASSIGAEIREGLSAIWRNTVLRALAWALSVWQIFRHASLAIVVLYAARELGFSAGRVGALWLLAGIGSIGATAACTFFSLKLRNTSSKRGHGSVSTRRPSSLRAASSLKAPRSP